MTKWKNYSDLRLTFLPSDGKFAMPYFFTYFLVYRPKNNKKKGAGGGKK